MNELQWILAVVGTGIVCALGVVAVVLCFWIVVVLRASIWTIRQRMAQGRSPFEGW
jgi:hypothetical protein